MRSFARACIVAVALAGSTQAQAQTPAAATPPATGMAPGLKVTEFSPNIRRFKLVFAKGDEVAAGLAEFAAKNHLTDAHFTAIGAFDSALLQISDPAHKTHKMIKLDGEMEVTSFTGNITRDTKGNPAVHIHCVVALLKDGKPYAGHFVEGRISLTMQLYLEDAEPLSPAQP
jgi:hypothetical protein